ncbi:hypothetical protein F2Q70_00008133 [Brassica cretica]|uniref:RNA methyltransferase n=1 Tax=Brassica cretica TaxID=69181 RepID=A0A8S9JID9_BRACR|nr:hypothetical protein F2Q68_00001162 [Brassica cretica]KAF2615632.1 hypothetical protein F2Q70_00008133 [Brassica cretica]
MGQDNDETKTRRKRRGRSKEKKSSEKVVTNEEQKKQQGNGSNPSKKKKSQEFCPFGNYKNYYGYRISNDMDEDPRLKVMKKEWFQGKDCLDIGCNSGVMTIHIAKKFGCRSILGVDIDSRQSFEVGSSCSVTCVLFFGDRLGLEQWRILHQACQA